MDNNKFDKILESANEALFTNEIQDEASSLVATIMEGLDLKTIIAELFSYSQSVSAMTMTKILHTMYSEEEIDKMIEAHTDFIAGNLVSEISNFLEAN
jgi:hypothetical protein